jgi:ubiquinone/menaquinone biosynthesis C-methylase UbiE
MTGSSVDAEARKQAIAAVFDRGAESYDLGGLGFFGAAGRDLVTAADVRPGERVLDLGCGRGAVLFEAADRVGATGSVIATDLSPRMVELSRREAADRGLTHVRVEIGDAERPAGSPGDFDVVLASFVLFFLADLPGALSRYRELLNPGGRLGFTVFGAPDPNFEAAMEAIGRFAPEAPDRRSRQGPLADAHGIRAVLATAGFADPTIEDRTYETRFADLDEWLTWVWSHGGRATLERVPVDRRADASAAGKAAFAPSRTSVGDHVLRTGVRLVVASRA